MSDELFRQGERLTAAKLNRLLTGTRATSVVSDELDGFGDTPGTIVIRETDGWEALGPGTDGQVLTIGADSIPGWEDPATSGTVTSVAVSGGTTGLTTSGGPVTSTGTITLAGTLAVANGGTGATTAGGALTNLGVSAFAQTVLDDADAAAARTTLGAAAASHTHTAADVSDFTEAAQDVVGAMVAAAGGSYNDGAGTITLPSASGAITGGTLTMSTNRLLGRTTASTGAIEEISIGGGLSLASGTLSAFGAQGLADSVPSTSTYSTWVNQGGATATQRTYGISFYCPAGGTSNNWRMLVTSLSSTTFDFKSRILAARIGKNFLNAGVVVRRSGTGQFINIAVDGAVQRFTNETTFSATMNGVAAFANYPVWFRITGDGTTLRFYASADGETWAEIYSEAFATWLGTPNQVGFGINACNQATPNAEVVMTIFSASLT